MVMIVKDHEKQAHGFISVTRPPRYPRRPARGGFQGTGGAGTGPGWRPGSPGYCPAARGRKARTLALGTHRSEQ
jgi:hypothetical protein